MKLYDATAALKALGQPARLGLFRQLVQAGAPGLTVGQLQAASQCAGATLTHHLHALRRAGLIVDRRDGRSITCQADFGRMRELLGYLTEHCCAGASCTDAAPCPTPGSNRKPRRTPR